jgi:hypothetical protein
MRVEARLESIAEAVGGTMAKRKKTPDELARERAEDEERWRRMRERIAENEAKIAEERARAERRQRLLRCVLPFLRESAS